MNLDMKLSLGSKKIIYPSKTTLNLVMKDKRKRSVAKMVPMVAALVLVALVLSKFMVVDRITAVNKAEAEAAASQEKLDAIIASNSDYDEVYEEYLRYSKLDSLTGEAIVNRITVLKLIEDKLLGSARIESFSISFNTLSLSLADITLADASAILESLYADPSVVNVKVSNAGAIKDGAGNVQTANADAYRVSMTVTLGVPGVTGVAQSERGGEAH